MSGIFAKISQSRMEDILENLHAFINLPIRLIDSQGIRVLSYGSSPQYCTLLKSKLFSDSVCLNGYLQAGQRAQYLGEPYIFACCANLNHIAFPLLDQKELLGCIIIGPFLMDEPDSTLISDFAEKHHLSPALSLDLYDGLGSLQVVLPARVNQLSKLIGHLFSPLLPAEQALMKESQQKLYQQSRINEAIQMYKDQGLRASQNFFHTKETELLTKVRTGNIQQSKALLNELIGHVLFSEGGKVETIRIHALELTTLLSRVAIDGGASADKVYALNRQFIALMSQEQDLEALCYLLQDVVESFMDAMFHYQDQGNIHIRKALQYISTNYSQHLTLPMVAEEAGLSPSHFSTLFKKVVGIQFRDYLCQVRIEESKRLLRSTDYSLADIAASMGFPDQSYFCKVFKRIVGISPGKFRN